MKFETVRIHFLSEWWEASALTTAPLLLPLSLLTTLPLLLYPLLLSACYCKTQCKTKNVD